MSLPAAPSCEVPPAGQIGLFEHGRDPVPRNRALDALLQRDAPAALAAQAVAGIPSWWRQPAPSAACMKSR